MINKLGLAALSLALVAGATPAFASDWTLVDWNGTQVWGAEWTPDTKLSFKAPGVGGGDPWYRIYFDGYTEEYMSGNTALPGLASTVLYKLTDVTNNNKNWTFEYIVENASHEPVETSRVSMIGFDVDPNVKSGNGVVLHSGGVYKTVGGWYRNGDGEFDFSDDHGYEDDFDVCFTTKSSSTSNNCEPGNNVGPKLGESGGGSFTLKFSSSKSEIFLLNPVVGYDDIDFEIPTLRTTHTKYGSWYDSKYGHGHKHDSRCGHGGKDDGGFGTPVAYVPEPATWGMMILGFGAVGAVVRRRRRLAA